MNLKKFASFALALCLLLPTGAQAGEYGVYLTPKIGLGIQYMKGAWENGATAPKGYETVFGGGLAVGYDFLNIYNLPVRAELEYDYWSHSERKETGRDYNAKANVGLQSLFANVYYDWLTGTPFTPYVGGGIGLGFVTVKGHEYEDGRSYSYASKTTPNFAWNLGLGCAYTINDMFAVDLGYRYASLGEGKAQADYGRSLKSKDNTMHQFMLGARFTF